MPAASSQSRLRAACDLLAKLALAWLVACVLLAGPGGEAASAASSCGTASAGQMPPGACGHPAGRATVSPARRVHILEGDATGGGHRAGTGEPGKSEFPPWPDNDIIAAIETVANDPANPWVRQPNGRWRVDGSTRGLSLRVIIGRDGHSIVTAYPRRTPH